MMTVVALVAVVMAVAAIWLYRRQHSLKERAWLMREAVRNRDFTFRLPTRGLLFGERALQEALNDTCADMARLMARNEIESWQRLARVLTHEIMNTAAPIQSISQAYLNNPNMRGSQYEEGIRAIYDASAGLLAFVDSYRSLMQLQKPVLTDVCLAEVVMSVRTLYPELAWKSDIAPDVILHADEAMLRQVLINLVKNAAEAGAKSLCMRWDGALSVSNDGMPIPAEVRNDVFIPFFTTKSEGHGIGLAISRQMLMMQGMSLVLADNPVCGYHVTFVISREDY